MLEIPRSQRRGAPPMLLVYAAAFAGLTGLAMLFVDERVARLVARYEPLTVLTDIVEKLEWLVLLPTLPWMFAIVLAAVMLACVIVPPWRWLAPAFMFLTASNVIGRALTGYIKEGTGRLRPLEWIRAGAADGALGSFGWEKGISFPSGHVTIFASAIVPLVVLKPRLWPLLGIVAYVMIARVAVDAHWISDVLGGVVLVALVTAACAAVIRPRRAA